MPAVDPAAPLSVAEQAAMLAELLAKQNIIVALADDVRAAAVALALEAAMPTAAVLFCPGSDALPGEDAPPSPANVGQRVSALRRARRLAAEKSPPRIALVTTGEALARAYPAPAAFDSVPPTIRAG